MKLYKYSILALCAAAFTALTGCEQEADHFLSEIKVSTSYVSLPAEGGETTVTLTADEAWAFDKVYTLKTGEKDENNKDITVQAIAPEWLTLDPVSGEAGEITITFKAGAAEETREATVVIACAGKKQNINVIQMTEKAELPILTIAEALEIIKPLEEGAVAPGTYRVKGKVCKITEISTQYGNATFYLSDDGTFQGNSKANCNWLQVYRGLWLNGGAFTSGDEFDVGDELVIEGLLMDYKGTPETKEKAAFVVSITKSLIKIEGVDYGTTTDEEGKEIARTSFPAEGGEARLKLTAKVSPLIVSSDASWLTIADVKDGDYILEAAANDYTAVRKAHISIKGDGAVASVEVVQDGVPATGATVTDIAAMADDSQIETLECTVIAKSARGVVIWDGATALYVYDKEKFAGVNVGDNVKIFGKKTTYNGVPEITDVTDFVVYSNGNLFELPSPVDVTADALTYQADKAEYIKLTGTLTVSGTYYNLLLDGVDSATKQGSINYPVDELDAASFNEKKVTVTGWYNGLSSGGKFLNIIATKIVEAVDNPKGTLTNPYLPSEIAALILGGTIPEEDVYVKGVVSVVKEFSASYGNITFWISDDGVANGVSEDMKTTTEPTKDFEAYRVYWFDNQKWAEGQAQVVAGDEVVLYGKMAVYNGIAETSQNKAWVYSVNGATTDADGLGSAEYPFNVAGVEAFIDRMVAAKAEAAANELPAPVFPDVCVKGKVSAVQGEFGAQYGNGTFWISDDGVAYGIAEDKKSTTEPAKDFECYRVLWFGGEKWAEGQPQVVVGDEVIVKGQMTFYAAKGIYETDQNKAWVYSLNGATE